MHPKLQLQMLPSAECLSSEPQAATATASAAFKPPADRLSSGSAAAPVSFLRKRMRSKTTAIDTATDTAIAAFVLVVSRSIGDNGRHIHVCIHMHIYIYMYMWM